MSAAIELHPELAELRRRVAALGRELGRALVEWEELTRVRGPGLLLRYQAVLGPAELGALEAEVGFRRARRALELARAAMVRGETPCRAVMDQELDREFAAWQRRVEAAVHKLQSAQHWIAGAVMSEAEFRELQSLFRALVLRLHPDLQGDLSATERQLWQRVQEAYAARDLGALRDLALILEGALPTQPEDNAVSALERLQDNLSERLRQALADLERVRSSPPLTLEPLLADPAWVASRRLEAEHRAQDLDRARQTLEHELNLLMIGRHVPDSGSN